MKRLLALLFLCPLAAAAQFTIPMHTGAPAAGSGGGAAFGAEDIFIPFTTGTPAAAITPTVAAAGTLPTGTAPCTWTRNGTSGNLTIGASQGSLGGSVGPVGGTTYPSSTTTQSIAINDSDGTSLPTAICAFTAGSPGNIGTVGAYVTMGPAIAANSDLLFDREVTRSTIGYAAAQLEDGQQCLADGGYGLNIETNPSGVTTHSPCIPVAVGGRYWVTMQFNGTSGTAQMCAYNPVNFGLVSCTSVAQSTGGALADFRVGQNENGSSATTSYIEDVMFNYTTHPFPMLPSGASGATVPTYVGQGSANGAAAPGTTITVARTPASTSNGFIVFACTTGTTGTISLADTQGNTYTNISGPTNLTLGLRCSAFTKFGLASTASDTLTATYGTSSTARVIYMAEFTNGTAVDQNTGFINKTTVAGGLYTSTAATPTASPELAIGFGVSTGGTGAGAGWAPVSMETITVGMLEGAQLNSLSSTSANFFAYGLASGTTAAADLVTIK